MNQSDNTSHLNTNLPIPSHCLPSLTTAKPNSEFPDEAKQLDGVPLAALTPGENDAGVSGAIGTPVRTDGKGNPHPAVADANSTEFMLHPDGTLMKYVAAPRVPQQFLVDGQGRQFGVARNPEVAELICNAVNAMNLAAMQIRAEQQKEQGAGDGQPPAIFTSFTPGEIKNN